MVMDASRPEQVAVHAYVNALPNPFPIQPAEEQAHILNGKPMIYCHVDSTNADAGRVWISWAAAGTGDADLELPLIRRQVKTVQVDGGETMMTVTSRSVRIHLRGEAKMAPPVLIIDRRGSTSQ